MAGRGPPKIGPTFSIKLISDDLAPAAEERRRRGGGRREGLQVEGFWGVCRPPPGSVNEISGKYLLLRMFQNGRHPAAFETMCDRPWRNVTAPGSRPRPIPVGRDSENAHTCQRTSTLRGWRGSNPGAGPEPAPGTCPGSGPDPTRYPDSERDAAAAVR